MDHEAHFEVILVLLVVFLLLDNVLLRRAVQALWQLEFAGGQL